VAQPELASLFAPVSAALERVERGLWAAVADEDPEVMAPVVHLLGAGGKRIRPALVLLGAWVGDGGGQTAVDVAVAAELIHTATLVHDDIIDRAPLRRGVPTVHAQWGERVAVLAGDALFARAFTLLGNTGDPRLVAAMARAVYGTCQGEIRQNLDARTGRVPSEVDYFTRIGRKTALLIAECVRAGGIAGGVGGPALDALYDFGYHAGLAYQVVDDLLDIAAAAPEVGKAVGADLADGVLTLPVIRALSRLPENSPDRWLVAAAARGEVQPAAVRDLLDRTGALRSVAETAAELVEQARRDVHGLEPAAREQFEQLAAYLARRTA
jgi:heptaprenyl diphosphate synthase